MGVSRCGRIGELACFLFPKHRLFSLLCDSFREDRFLSPFVFLVMDGDVQKKVPIFVSFPIEIRAGLCGELNKFVGSGELV